MEKKSKDCYKIYHPDRCDPLVRAGNMGELKMRALKRADYPGQKIPEAVLPGILSIGYWDAKVIQNWGLNWHRNEGIELTFLHSGSLHFSTKKDQFNLDSGSLTVTRPWQPHKVGNPNVTVGKLSWLILDLDVHQPHQKWKWPDWIILSEEDLHSLTLILRQNECQVWHSNKRIRECFNELDYCLDYLESGIQHSKFNILINNLFLEILCLFKKGKMEMDDSSTLNLHTVGIFLKHLQMNYEELWTLNTMAENCGIGKTSLSKYFKQLTNMTPMDYLINLRLDAAAKELCNNHGKPISSLSYECGFSSSQYFSTVFKKRFKYIPSEYAALHKESK